MPIPIDYPHDLLPAPLIGKQRSVQQKYDTRENFDGKMLTRKKRDSSRVYFDVSVFIPYGKSQLMALLLEGVDDVDAKNIVSYASWVFTQEKVDSLPKKDQLTGYEKRALLAFARAVIRK